MQSVLRHIQKILLYAPCDDVGYKIMRGILKELNIHEETPSNDDRAQKNSNGWRLLPMLEGDLTGTDLGGKLEDALLRARQYTPNGGVVFLGMDAPMLSLDDIVLGLCNACPSRDDKGNDDKPASAHVVDERVAPFAMLCPADDGGYGMLCVPPNADHTKTFQGIYWSHPLTAISQVKALTDQNIVVKIGQVMNDIDEPLDVEALCTRLTTGGKDDGRNLSSHSGGLLKGRVTSHHPSCMHTRKALEASGLL
jgi:glycosyltransferase A (GT-A) superfamily protein (DUF2064 family)